MVLWVKTFIVAMTILKPNPRYLFWQEGRAGQQ